MCLKFLKKSKMVAILDDVTAFRRRHLPPPRWGEVQPFPLCQGGGVQRFAVRTSKKMRGSLFDGIFGQRVYNQ